MAKAYCTDDEFIRNWQETGGYLKSFIDKFGFSCLRTVGHRRRSIEKRLGITLASANPISSRNVALKVQNARRINLSLQDGTILIGSDAHIWPGDLTTAQRAFIKMARKLQPTILILNGDVFDGARISRHPAGIWDQEKRPSVEEEREAIEAFTGELEKACPNARKIWTWGNHDARFEYTLAAKVPEYKNVPGFALKDHFPAWTFCMAVFVNDSVVIKHRLANGIHAVYNNTVKSGRSIFTGHLHSPKVIPWTDYNGTRYGTDTGTLANPESQQFDYAEEAPSNHRAGFALATIRSGRILMPEICQVWDEDHVEFRGELIEV